MSYIENLFEKEILWQPSFKGDLKNGKEGYRGDLVLIEGKVINGNKMVPELIAKQGIMTVKDSKIEFVAVLLPAVADIESFVSLFKDALTSEGQYFIYTENADKDMIVEYEGCKFIVTLLDESTVWNELLDIAGLSKGDLKKLSAEEKITTLVEELSSETPSYESVSFEDAKTFVTQSTRVKHGAV